MPGLGWVGNWSFNKGCLEGPHWEGDIKQGITESEERNQLGI